MNEVKRLWTSDCGQGTSEYAFLLILIAIAALEATNTLGATVNRFFEEFVSLIP